MCVVLDLSLYCSSDFRLILSLSEFVKYITFFRRGLCCFHSNIIEYFGACGDNILLLN